MTTDTGFIDEPTLISRLPLSRRTLHNWRKSGILPYIQPPGSKRILYHWDTVLKALQRYQKGGKP